VTCTNPKCGQQFTVPAGSEPTPRSSAALSGSRRIPAALMRPSALSKLPPNIYASPAFVAGGAAIVFVYGIVLFGALSARRQAELAELARQEQLAASFHEAPIALPELSTHPAPTPAAIATPGKGASDPSKKQEPQASKKTSAPPKPDGMPQPGASPKAAPPPPAPAPKGNNSGGQPTQAKAASSPPAVALAPQPAPQPEPPPVPSNVAGIGSWLDPNGDCRFRMEGDELIVDVPGKVHLLSPDLRITNAPRILGDVDGDFSATVRIPGRILPGTKPLKDFPFTFQGAGLLVWQDDRNYLRLERGALNANDRPLVHQVLLETCRDGKPGRPVYFEVREKPLILRVERKANEINCSYSPDGKTWIQVKNAVNPFASKVQVGISASNASPKPFAARFEGFTLDQAGGRGGKVRKS